MTQQNRSFAIPFHSGDGLGCNYYRIPALITTQQGVTIAAMDARFGGLHDSPNNLDTALSLSNDCGKTWSKPTLPFHLVDYADSDARLPLRNGAMATKPSASTIDPCLLEDRETGRIFFVGGYVPRRIWFPQAKTGSGYAQIGGEACLRLRKRAAFPFAIMRARME